MKAKEYAEKCIKEIEAISDNESPEFMFMKVGDIVARIGTDIYCECEQILEVRKAQSDSAVIAVLKEQDRKYRSFVKSISATVKKKTSDRIEIKPNGFHDFILSKLEVDIDTAII